MRKLLLLLLLPLTALGQAPTSDSTLFTGNVPFTPNTWKYKGSNYSQMQIQFNIVGTSKWPQVVTGYQFNNYIGTSVATALALKAPINNATFTGTTNADLFRITQSALSSDGMGRNSVTLGADGNNYAYFGLTRRTAVAWGWGIATNNSLIWGTSPSRDIGSTIDTVKASLSTQGDLTVGGWIKGQHLAGTAGTDSIAGIDGSGRLVRFAPTAFSKTDSALSKPKNLFDVPNKATARTNLSVYSKAETDAGFIKNGTTLQTGNFKIDGIGYAAQFRAEVSGDPGTSGATTSGLFSYSGDSQTNVSAGAIGITTASANGSLLASGSGILLNSVNNLEFSGTHVKSAPTPTESTDIIRLTDLSNYAKKDSTYNINKNGFDILNKTTFRANLNVANKDSTLLKTQNLFGLANLTTSRTNLGLTGTLTAGRGITGTSYFPTAAATFRLDTNQNYTWTKQQTIKIAGTQLTLDDNAGGNATFSVASGQLTIGRSSGQPTILTNGFAMSTSEVGGWFSRSTFSSYTDPLNLQPGQTTIQARTGITNGSAQAVTANTSAYNTIFGSSRLMQATTGTHPEFGNVLILPLTVSASTATTTNAFTLKIGGAPASGAINKYAIWTAGGLSRNDGTLQLTNTPTGTAGTDSVLVLKSDRTIGKVAANYYATGSGYIATTGTQTGLTGNKTTSGSWSFGGVTTTAGNVDILDGYATRFWNLGSTFSANVYAGTLTASRAILWPDAPGTVALTSDLVDYAVNATTSALSNANLNSSYPSVSVGYRVICYNITGAPAIYTKATEAGISDVWLTALVTTTP